MRLLNTNELKVEEFNDINRPPYAILSHTWEDGEVSFQDIQTPKAASMAGYIKILNCCEIAKRDGFKYVWIDTCCIDKTSSAELSEAINSMFKWYQDADVCYVYLSGVQARWEDLQVLEEAEATFRNCRWFKRGWTLQELLAPEIIAFYNEDWVNIGSKNTLQEPISEATGIPREALLDAKHIQKVSIAARMAWASTRETTRIEDKAYCLMGIFDVNMPPLYGEGDKAFRRLQLEIIKESRDESIFAWSDGRPLPWLNLIATSNPPMSEPDALASSPLAFRNCHDVKCNDQDQEKSRPPFSISNKGLHIWLPSIPTKDKLGNYLLLAGLNCMFDGKQIFIALMDIEPGEYIRWSQKTYTTVGMFVPMTIWGPPDGPNNKAKELYIVRRPILPQKDDFLPVYESSPIIVFHFNKNSSPESGYCIESFAFHGKLGQETDIPPDRTFVLNKEGYTGDYKDWMHFVVSSIQDPLVQATVALGVVHKAGKITYQCRIFSGPNYPSHTGLEEMDESSGEPKFQSIPNDMIVRRLHRDYVISMSARTGPLERAYRHYHIEIAFKYLVSQKGQIPAADVVLGNGDIFCIDTSSTHARLRTI